MGLGLIKGLGKIAGRLLGIGARKPEDSVLGTVLNKVIKDKDLVARINSELALEYMKQEHKLLSWEHDFRMEILKDVSRSRSMYEVELREIKGKAIDFLRAFPRPFLAIMAGLIWAWSCFTYYYPGIEHIPLTYQDYGLITVVFGFYFYYRGKEKTQKLKLNNGSLLEKMKI